MLLRIAFSSMLFVLLAMPIVAQTEGDEPSPDTTDTSFEPTYGGLDTTDSFPEGAVDADDLPAERTFFTRRSGIYGGPTIEFSRLSPAKLDPVLDGDMVLYGGQGYLIINGWLIGGGGWGAVLYDLSPKYDQFSFGYGGLLLGYDQGLAYGDLSIRPTVMIGSGGLTMIKKRPDIVDSTGHEMLERYRDESFFAIRPGISIGFQILPFLDLRVSADYLMPVGGARVSDLKEMTYGMQLMFGFGGQ